MQSLCCCIKFMNMHCKYHYVCCWVFIYSSINILEYISVYHFVSLKRSSGSKVLNAQSELRRLILEYISTRSTQVADPCILYIIDKCPFHDLDMLSCLSCIFWIVCVIGDCWSSITGIMEVIVEARWGQSRGISDNQTSDVYTHKN